MSREIVIEPGDVLSARMLAAPATTNPNWIASYYVETDPYSYWDEWRSRWVTSKVPTLTESARDGVFDGTNSVIIIPDLLNPIPRYKTLLDLIIYNADTAIVTIRLMLDWDSQILYTFTLNPGDTYTLHGTYNDKGQIKVR